MTPGFPRLFAITLLVSSLHAETNLEKGKRIVLESLEALGGKAFQSVQDRTETGRAYSFYRERLTGLAVARIMTKYETPKPGEIAVREREAFGKKEDQLVLLLPEGCYQLTYRGAKPLPKDRVERYRESTLRNVFYILRERMDEPGLNFEYKGADIFENAPVEVVDIYDSVNRSVTVYFHQSTKLPIRQIFTVRDPDTKERNEEVSRFTKYRNVGGGVQWPFNILRERNGEKIFELFSESVTVNNNLKESLFVLPTGTNVIKQ